MDDLYCRLLDLRDEYFSGMDNTQVAHLWVELDEDKEYTSDELIDIMGEFYDK